MEHFTSLWNSLFITLFLSMLLRISYILEGFTWQGLPPAMYIINIAADDSCHKFLW